MDTASSLVAIVPLKALPAAKGRLAPALGPRQRRDLVCWMLERVVAACAASRWVERTLVVAGDPDGVAVARACGAEAFREAAPGLSAAIDAADARLAGTSATLVVAGDLPLVTGEDIDAVSAAGADGPVVVVAPTLDGGTGALLRRPPRTVAASFGPGSAARHLDLARREGIRAVRVQRAGLELDVDDAEGLRLAAARLPDLAAVARR